MRIIDIGFENKAIASEHIGCIVRTRDTFTVLITFDEWYYYTGIGPQMAVAVPDKPIPINRTKVPLKFTETSALPVDFREWRWNFDLGEVDFDKNIFYDKNGVSHFYIEGTPENNN